MPPRDLSTPPTAGEWIVERDFRSRSALAAFDPEPSNSWEVVWDESGTVAEARFIFKRDHVMASGSKFFAKVTVKEEPTNSSPIVDNENELRMVILHHMVNCDKFWAKRGKNAEAVNDKFYAHLPPCRRKEISQIDTIIPDGIFKKIEALISTKVLRISEEHKWMGFVTQGEEFQTYDTSENLGKQSVVKDNPVRVARIAKEQVNHRRWDGVIRLDGHLMGMEMLKNSVLASARENDWGVDDMQELAEFVAARKEDFLASESNAPLDVAGLVVSKKGFSRRG